MKIVALDFETADNGPDSACALAMVAIEDGKISGQKSFLIRPPRDTFVYTYIHGITWAHVRNELIFAERIPEIEEFIRNASYLVAHNAPFDRRVLYNCYSVSGHSPPANPFSCTVRLARAAWQIHPTKLPDVCSHLGIALNHHDAQSDALACARIAIAAQEAGIPIEMGLVGPRTYKLLRPISASGPVRRAPRAQSRREKSRLARCAVCGKSGFFLRLKDGVCDACHPEIAEMISNYGRIINESVAIAEKSTNLKKVVSRLGVAVDVIWKLVELAERGIVVDRNREELAELASELDTRKSKAEERLRAESMLRGLDQSKPDQEKPVWAATATDDDIGNHVIRFWKGMREDLENGRFWGDEIKKLRKKPNERLSAALRAFPLPGAFRESAIALRALIREKRKAKEDCERELAFLYGLAALNSFMLPYSERLDEPGFNVFESIPAKTLFELPFTYHKLGAEKLELLNKTDRKWFQEAWGEPDCHTTLYSLHSDIWQRYEDKLIEQRIQEKDSSEQEWLRLAGKKTTKRGSRMTVEDYVAFKAQARQRFAEMNTHVPPTLPSVKALPQASERRRAYGGVWLTALIVAVLLALLWVVGF